MKSFSFNTRKEKCKKYPNNKTILKLYLKILLVPAILLVIFTNLFFIESWKIDFFNNTTFVVIA